MQSHKTTCRRAPQCKKTSAMLLNIEEGIVPPAQCRNTDMTTIKMTVLALALAVAGFAAAAPAQAGYYGYGYSYGYSSYSYDCYGY